MCIILTMGGKSHEPEDEHTAIFFLASSDCINSVPRKLLAPAEEWIVSLPTEKYDSNGQVSHLMIVALFSSVGFD